MLPLTIVAGVVQQGDSLLLVRQPFGAEPEPVWTLPGGVARPGEFAPAALAREIAEETGLTITLGRLLYISQSIDARTGYHATALVYLASNPQGPLGPRDPDGEILEARFVPLLQARTLLTSLPSRAMREPLLAHLDGDLPPGSTWCYRVVDGIEHLEIVTR